MEKNQSFGLAYGMWTTFEGERLMITNWNASGTMVLLYKVHESQWVPVDEISNTSDFMETPEERAAKGYAF